MRSSGHDVKDTLSAKDAFYAIRCGLQRPPKGPYPRGLFVYFRPMSPIASQRLLGVFLGVWGYSIGGISRKH